jgi:hypothetical protein
MAVWPDSSRELGSNHVALIAVRRLACRTAQPGRSPHRRRKDRKNINTENGVDSKSIATLSSRMRAIDCRRAGRRSGVLVACDFPTTGSSPQQAWPAQEDRPADSPCRDAAPASKAVGLDQASLSGTKRATSRSDSALRRSGFRRTRP